MNTDKVSNIIRMNWANDNMAIVGDTWKLYDLFFPGIPSPQTRLERIIDWLVARRQRKSGKPWDFEIRGTRGEGDPAVYRWWLIPRNKVFNIYLHKFMQDDRQHLHDHSQPIEGVMLPETYVRRCEPGKVYFRMAETAHQVIVDRDAEGYNIASWSLFFTGPVGRIWGFWCPGKPSKVTGFKTMCFWRPFESYTKPGSGYGQTGAGCE